MNEKQLAHLKAWFDQYSRSFLPVDSPDSSPLQLKIEHTAGVCRNIVRLARSIDLSADRIRTAEAVGLLHDAGRFEQYRRFNTFSDRRSVNHAALGVRVLLSAAVLDSLDDAEKTAILVAIRFHNALQIPRRPTSAARTFLALIRDADKLDIWRVFADYYRRPQWDPAIVQHLPDVETWQTSIVAAVLEKQMARLKDMRSLNDLKLLQLSWVFDLNFQESFRLAVDKGHLQAIARTLPRAPHIDRAVTTVLTHLKRMAGCPPPANDRPRGR